MIYFLSSAQHECRCLQLRLINPFCPELIFGVPKISIKVSDVTCYHCYMVSLLHGITVTWYHCYMVSLGQIGLRKRLKYLYLFDSYSIKNVEKLQRRSVPSDFRRLIYPIRIEMIWIDAYNILIGAINPLICDFPWRSNAIPTHLYIVS